MLSNYTKTNSELIFELGEQLVRLGLVSANPTLSKKVRFENNVFSLSYSNILEKSLYFKGTDKIKPITINYLTSKHLVNEIINECYNSLF